MVDLSLLRFQGGMTGSSGSGGGTPYTPSPSLYSDFHPVLRTPVRGFLNDVATVSLSWLYSECLLRLAMACWCLLTHALYTSDLPSCLAVGTGFKYLRILDTRMDKAKAINVVSCCYGVGARLCQGITGGPLFPTECAFAGSEVCGARPAVPQSLAVLQ